MTILTGVTRTDQLDSSQKVIMMEDAAKRLEDGSYKLLSSIQIAGGGRRNSHSMKYEWRERNLIPEVATVTTAGSVGDTTLAMDHPEYFNNDDIVAVASTGETLLVQETTVGGTAAAGKLTFVRTTGSGGLVNAVANGSLVVRLTEAHAEGEAIPSGRGITEDPYYTYVMQSDLVFGVTDRILNVKQYGGDERAKKRMDAMIERARAWDRMIWFGTKAKDTTSASSRERYVMDGLRGPLATRQVDLSGFTGVSLRDLGTLVRPTRIYGASSNEKLLLCGTNMWQQICDYPSQAVRAEAGKDQVWGTTVKRLYTHGGDLIVDQCSLFAPEFGQAGESVILDPKAVYLIQLEGDPERMLMDVQNRSDVHNVNDMFTGTLGLVVSQLPLHRHLTGLK